MKNRSITSICPSSWDAGVGRGPTRFYPQRRRERREEQPEAAYLTAFSGRASTMRKKTLQSRNHEHSLFRQGVPLPKETILMEEDGEA